MAATWDDAAATWDDLDFAWDGTPLGVALPDDVAIAHLVLTRPSASLALARPSSSSLTLQRPRDVALPSFLVQTG